jgi:phosphomannomutase/phosphoglucomutase
MTSHIFREYDIRGVADRDLTDPLVEALGRGLGELLPPSADASAKPARIVVARDCRISGERLRNALVKGLLGAGVDVIDIGVGPTPLMYFGVHHLAADGGIMITGSHNPGHENGFKIMKHTHSFFGEQIQALRRLIESGSFRAAARRGNVSETKIEDAYVGALKRGVSIANTTSLRFAIDAGNGAAGPLGRRVFTELGLTPTALFCEMDGTFPNHHPDPTVPENLGTLVEWVKSHDANVGIAWDGDGDRLGVVDRSGEMIWGDRLLALFARNLLETAPGATVIGDVKCSGTLFDDVRAHGGRGIMWKTGHSLIKTKMKEEHAALAGEMSGHFFFADRYFGYDDGIYAALRLIEILAKENRSVGELLADLPVPYSTPEIRVPCPDDLKFKVVQAVRDHFTAIATVDPIDGARVQYADGAWGLVRASNTGPILVLRFEAPTVERLNNLRHEFESVIQQCRARLEAS